MWLEQLLNLDIDTVRFVLLASVVAAVIVYMRLRISEGGTLTAGYLVILAMSGRAGVIGRDQLRYGTVRSMLWRGSRLGVSPLSGLSD